MMYLEIQRTSRYLVDTGQKDAVNALRPESILSRMLAGLVLNRC